MSLPTDVSGLQLKRALEREGFVQEHQSGSHLKLALTEGTRRCIVIVPMHNPIAPGTLRSILRNLAEFYGASIDELVRRLRL